MSKILIPRETAQELAWSVVGDSVGDYTVVANDYLNATRWGSLFALVINTNYGYWQAIYEETNSSVPFEDENDLVEFHNVVAVPKVSIEWLTPEERDQRENEGML